MVFIGYELGDKEGEDSDTIPLPKFEWSKIANTGMARGLCNQKFQQSECVCPVKF